MQLDGGVQRLVLGVLTSEQPKEPFLLSLQDLRLG
jgi:hypothetical protein